MRAEQPRRGSTRLPAASVITYFCPTAGVERRLPAPPAQPEPRGVVSPTSTLIRQLGNFSRRYWMRRMVVSGIRPLIVTVSPASFTFPRSVDKTGGSWVYACFAALVARDSFQPSLEMKPAAPSCSETISDLDEIRSLVMSGSSLKLTVVRLPVSWLRTT